MDIPARNAARLGEQTNSVNSPSVSYSGSFRYPHLVQRSTITKPIRTGQNTDPRSTERGSSIGGNDLIDCLSRFPGAPEVIGRCSP